MSSYVEVPSWRHHPQHGDPRVEAMVRGTAGGYANTTVLNTDPPLGVITYHREAADDGPERSMRPTEVPSIRKTRDRWYRGTLSVSRRL
jgi:hypothetical protein